MRVVFSPWRTTTSASAAVASSDVGTSRRTKAKRSTNGSSSSYSACARRQIQACFITGRSSKRAYGGGGGSKRQRKSSKISGASSSADINSNNGALLPLLALTSDHKISVISESLAGSAVASSRGDASPSLIEDSRWTSASNPGMLYLGSVVEESLWRRRHQQASTQIIEHVWRFFFRRHQQ